jgi:hypothetical protein
MRPRSLLYGAVSLALALAALGACTPPPPKPPVKPPSTTNPPVTAGTLPLTATGTPDGMTFLAGKPSPQYNNDASRTIISGDGNFVVYHHKSVNLAVANKPPSSCPRPAATSSQVYRTDLRTGQTLLVSKGTDGCYANGESTFPFTNTDGRYVVYMSVASNLIAGDTNGSADIFLKDMLTGTTTRVSLRQNGAQLSAPSTRPSMSGDGKKIVFNTTASNIIANDTNGQPDCYMYNTATGPAGIQRISLGDQGQQANGFNFRCDISESAAAVVWVSDATNLISTPGLGTPKRAVYVRNLLNNTTELVSKTPTGHFPSQTATRAAIGANARFVVYQSTATDIVPGDPDSNFDIFRYDRQTGQTVEVSVDKNDNRAAAASTRPVVSADGRYVAFVSNSSQLVPVDKNHTRDVFMRDMLSGTTFLLSVNTAEQQGVPCGTPLASAASPSTDAADMADAAGVVPAAGSLGADDISTRPTVSDDGLVVAFISDVCNLVPEQAQMAGYAGVIVRWMRQPIPPQR